MIPWAPALCPVCWRAGLRVTVGHVMIAPDGCGQFVPLLRSGRPGPSGSRTELVGPVGDPEETLPHRVRCRRGHDLIVDQAVADVVARRGVREPVLPVYLRRAK